MSELINGIIKESFIVLSIDHLEDSSSVDVERVDISTEDEEFEDFPSFKEYSDHCKNEKLAELEQRFINCMIISDKEVDKTIEALQKESTIQLKKKLNEGFDFLLGKVKPLDLKRWVSTTERQPIEEKYYMVLKEDSNPNLIHTCQSAVHFWHADKKEWSSKTAYWLEDIKTENIKDDIKSSLYKHLSKVDYEVRSKYDISDAIEDSLNELLK